MAYKSAVPSMNRRPVTTVRQVNPPAPTRRSRTSRDDGRRNVLQATIELLDERDPDAITVRDIGERAGHHHRFVQDWFGGKAALFLEVLHATAAELAEAMDLGGYQVNPEPNQVVIRAVKLTNWLTANAPDQMTGDRMRPMVTRLEHFFQDRFGVESPDSKLLAQHAMLVITGFVLFRDAYGLEPTDYQRLLTMQFQLGQLLGTRSGN
jgi:AcrR family transcriptional regulator